MSQETEQFDQLPEALIRRLKARERAVAEFTPAIDRAVLEAARAQFSPRHPHAAATRRWQYPAAVAAAVALLALFIARPFDETSVGVLRTADDVDGSGQVDVLDAFALARAQAEDPDAVGETRIRELMSRIVALDPPEAVL